MIREKHSMVEALNLSSQPTSFNDPTLPLDPIKARILQDKSLLEDRFTQLDQCENFTPDFSRSRGRPGKNKGIANAPVRRLSRLNPTVSQC
jgi:hypothetical protein